MLLYRYEEHTKTRLEINRQLLQIIIENTVNDPTFRISDALEMYDEYNKKDYSEVVLSLNKSVNDERSFLTEEQYYKLLKYKYETIKQYE